MALRDRIRDFASRVRQATRESTRILFGPTPELPRGVRAPPDIRASEQRDINRAWRASMRRGGGGADTFIGYLTSIGVDYDADEVYAAWRDDYADITA